jgi:Periplasmic protein involved in polysaccharide export
MKKVFFYLFLFFVCGLELHAQSSMSDEQVMKMILKEQKSGTSQSQIVTKLIQNGVDISQIRRLKAKYERYKDNKGMGNLTDENLPQTDDRLRKNNAKEKDSKEKDFSNLKLQDTKEKIKTYDKKNNNFLEMENELGTFMPTDSIKLLKELLAERDKEKRKVFGRDIFNNKELSFEPNMNISTPQKYVLGAGDAVIIDIYGASQKTINSTVSPDGDITIEGFGPVKVAGLTVEQANARLKNQLGARYSSSKIRLTVGQTKTIMINVMGEVSTPGTYTLSAFATVFHALYMAGGVNDLGTLRNIKVYRQNKLVSVVDIYDYILNGKLTGNIRLTDNDVIVVGPYDCLVTVTGKVKRPMIYEMKKNESVGTLLKYAGGFTGDAYRKAVRLLRKTGRELSVYNVGEFDFNTFHIADGDSIGVDSILNRYENKIEIKGAVFRPGFYNIGKDIHSVRTLIEHAEGLTEDAFTNRAIIHRMKEDRTLEVIAVDVKGILKGTVADIPLKKNDVLFIPTKSESQTQKTLTIHGEVHYPGVYVYADNETLEDLVLQAGGLKDKASTVKVDVSRRIVNPKALSTDSLISHTFTFALKDGFVIDGTSGFTLLPFDEVYVRKSPGYSEQQNVEVVGNVMFAGTYTLSTKNERLSDIIKKAGGLTDLAYVKGARLERRITPDERLRMNTVLKMAERQNSKKDSLDTKKLNIGDTYFVGIELDKALKEPGGDADIVLREHDRIIVPEFNGTVKISGEVMYPNTVSFEKNKSVRWYINQAGGWGNRAKRNHTYIIYMNGTVAKKSYKTKVRPGCEIVVPTKPEKGGNSLAQWLSIGTSVASIATMVATMTNLLRK